MDSLSPNRRSWNMSRIRAKDTRPERVVRSLLHRLGYRFCLNRNDIPGRPDIVLPKYSTAIFVHGCFWHRHKGCSLAYTPKSNLAFWNKKFQRNIQRDAEVAEALKRTTWKQLIVWECEIKDEAALSRRLKKSL